MKMKPTCLCDGRVPDAKLPRVWKRPLHFSCPRVTHKSYVNKVLAPGCCRVAPCVHDAVRARGRAVWAVACRRHASARRVFHIISRERQQENHRFVEKCAIMLPHQPIRVPSSTRAGTNRVAPPQRPRRMASHAAREWPPHIHPLTLVTVAPGLSAAGVSQR